VLANSISTGFHLGVDWRTRPKPEATLPGECLFYGAKVLLELLILAVGVRGKLPTPATPAAVNAVHNWY